jgi:beta-glucosidase
VFAAVGVARFPENFLWGVSTSAFQYEGNPQEIIPRASDWSNWTTIPHKISDGSNADIACNFFNSYNSDIELAKSLNLNAFRIGLNWAALSPSYTENRKFDREVFAYYRRVLSKIKDLGMVSFVTLFHFGLPRWLSDIGGWNNPATIDAFEKFAHAAATELGDLTDFWLTLNEPMVYLYQGYIKGIWPPGYLHERLRAFEAGRNLLIAHARAYHTIKQADSRAQVGYVNHWRPFIPRNQYSFLDRKTSSLRHELGNLLFFNAIKTGSFEFPHPINSHEYLKRISGPIEGLKSAYDFIALNYYTHEYCHFAFTWPLNLLGVQSNISRLESTPLGWEIYPEGLYEALTLGISPYIFDQEGIEKPVYITENGMATMYAPDLQDGQWSLNDPDRIRFITDHLKVIARAIGKGVNIKGYLHWSLLDNFEWHDGLTPRFGLVRVAYPSQKRDLRDSARFFAEVARNNSLEI